jgi:uncharacterized damage-inducible protein DinB
MNAELALLLRGIDEAFDRKSWHGTNLRGSLRGMSAAEAGWRVAPGRHSIQEIVLHCAYWKYAARRRILGEKRGKFPLKGSNWFKRPGGNDPLAWREVVRLLHLEHAHLRQAVTRMGARRPSNRLPGSSVTLEHLLRGIAAHDLYHAGQIQLIKRLRRTGRG